ncbi:hypothetical protein mRhiFer1_009864 [Rhinolophus ferrumequinum]|uniref:Uncharacterized protein n=1 Tax=Rhinolophus ferrumequinum TaxID=59479 RepID=A0A7J7YTD7_RHIFE|nr:hypothetical protein mRhiFer1_009864 [Rhinolophus ferrumequinum]
MTKCPGPTGLPSAYLYSLGFSVTVIICLPLSITVILTSLWFFRQAWFSGTLRLLYKPFPLLAHHAGCPSLHPTPSPPSHPSVLGSNAISSEASLKERKTPSECPHISLKPSFMARTMQVCNYC